LTYRVNEDERNAGETSDKRNKLVELSCTSPRDDGTERNHEESEYVLLPLDPRVILAGATKELLRSDLNSRVDLQGSGEQDGHRVDELHTVDKLVVLGHIEEDHSLCGATVGGVRKSAHGDEDDSDCNHDCS